MTQDHGDQTGRGGRLYCWSFANAEFDEARWQLRVAGQDVELEHKPLEVLQHLLRHAGEAVTKDELLSAVWAGRVVVEAVLTNAIGKLRRALADETQDIVLTLPRIGYRLAVPVARRQVEFVPDASKLDAGDAVPRRPNWRLESALARTGGNEVWLARHTKTREARVFKFSLAGKGLAGLKREVTVARLLRESLGEREDFVRALDWDFEQAPYFIESEYGGASMDRWPSNGELASVAVEQRLALFAQAAEAVAAAHSVGVLHKDLKPANLLIEGDGADARLRVADFGSSRLFDSGVLDELDITRLGLTQTQVLSSDSGTPLYLAPELVAGQSATIKSDVYALGVTLYQLLVGDFRRPLAPGWESDIDDVLLRQDIADAANGDPDKRLETASALADRIRSLAARREKRALELAVQARIKEGEKRLARARARRPWVIAAIGALAIGLCMTVWLLQRSVSAERIALVQREKAEAQAKRADAAIDFLSKEVFGAAAPGGSAYEKNPTAKEMLEHAARRVVEKFGSDPATSGSIYAALGASWGALRDRAKSAEFWRRAVASYKEAFGESGRETLLANYKLISALAAKGDFDQAVGELEVVGKVAATSLQVDQELALQALWTRGFLLIQRQDTREAEQVLRKADLLQRSVAPKDAVLATNIRSFLADAMLRNDRAEDAERLMTSTLAEPLASADSIGAANRANLELSLGRSLRAQGKMSDSLQALDRGYQAAKSVLGDGANLTRTLHRSMADIHGRLGNCGEALRILRQQWSNGVGSASEPRRTVLAIGNNLATWEYRCGNERLGVDLMRQVLGEQRKVQVEDDVVEQIYRYRLSEMLADQGNVDEARQLAVGLSADALAAATALKGWQQRLDALQAKILIKSGDYEQGRNLLAPALEQLASMGTEFPPELERLRRLL